MTEYIYQRLEDEELQKIVFSAPSLIHGTGLFSSRYIEEGEYIGTFHGPEVTEDGDHVLWIEGESGDEYVGVKGENILRFLNHAENANAEFHGLDLYARTDIQKNSEITLDYGS